jgi:hypothetical protein
LINFEDWVFLKDVDMFSLMLNNNYSITLNAISWLYYERINATTQAFQTITAFTFLRAYDDIQSLSVLYSLRKETFERRIKKIGWYRSKTYHVNCNTFWIQILFVLLQLFPTLSPKTRVKYIFFIDYFIFCLYSFFLHFSYQNSLAKHL